MNSTLHLLALIGTSFLSFVFVFCVTHIFYTEQAIDLCVAFLSGLPNDFLLGEYMNLLFNAGRYGLYPGV